MKAFLTALWALVACVAFCVLAGFAAKQSGDYRVSGAVAVYSEDDDAILTTIRIGNDSDAKAKLLIVATPGSAFAEWAHAHDGERIVLRLETASPMTRDGLR